MIIQVLPENSQGTQETNAPVEISAETIEIPTASDTVITDLHLTSRRQASALNRWSSFLPQSLPLKGVLKGLSWGLGVLSFAGAGLVLANRLKLRQELKKSDLQSMIGLNLEKFVGSWYEIAKFPHRGNTRKVGVMVNYEMIDPLTIKENYIYQEGDFDSKIIEQSNTLHLVDPANPARMQKERTGPLAMNYWVLEVGFDYDYAVIGTPDRQHLWILSRTHQLSPDKYDALMHRLKAQGFAVQDLIRVAHHGITVGETARPVINTEVSSRPLPPTTRKVPHKN
jgi:apolipoprotein D and lipocalin family protein